MPVLPTYDARETLEIGRMPQTDVSTIEQQAAAGMGRAVQGLGIGIGEVAQHMARRQDERDAFSAGIEDDARRAELAGLFDKARREAPEDGAGFYESFLKEADAIAQKRFKAMPPAQGMRYRERWQAERIAWGEKAAQEEAKAAERFATAKIAESANGLLTEIQASPDGAESAYQRGLERIAVAPISNARKSELSRVWYEQSRTVEAQARFGADPAAMAKAFGFRYVAPERPASGASGRAMPGSQRAGLAVSAFQREGLPPLAAAALAGNLVAESGVNPNARNPGDGRDGSDSIGVAQWNAERAAALKSYASTQGKDWRDHNVQFAFLVQELKTSERGTYERLVNAKTIEDATAAAVGFFRPAGWSWAAPQNAHNFSGRLSEARKAAGLVGEPSLPAEGSADAGPAPGASLARLDADETAGGDPRFANLPFETKQRLVHQAAVQEDRQLRAEDQAARVEAARAESDRKVMIDNLQYRASRGEAGMPEVDLLWRQGAFKSFEEYSSVTKLIEKAAEADGAYVRGQQKLSDPAAIWSPNDSGDKDALSAIDARTGAIDRLRKMDHGGANEIAGRFVSTGMVSKEAKGVFEGVIRAGNPAQLEFAMQTLDSMYRRNPNAFGEAFGADTMKVLTMWQASVDKNGGAFRERLKFASDPATKKARAEAEKEGRQLADKVSDRDLIDAISDYGAVGNFIHGRPGAPLGTDNAPGMAVLRQEYADHFADGFASSQGDATAAGAYAARMIKGTWAVSAASGGRVMKYAPETLPDAILPSVGGSRAWMSDQVQAAVKSELKLTPYEEIDPATSYPIPLKYSLVATPDTRAEIDAVRHGQPLPDGRKSPGWWLVWQDPRTAVWHQRVFYFDVDAAQEARRKHIANLEGKHQGVLVAVDQAQRDAQALQQATGVFRSPEWAAARERALRGEKPGYATAEFEKLAEKHRGVGDIPAPFSVIDPAYARD